MDTKDQQVRCQILSTITNHPRQLHAISITYNLRSTPLTRNQNLIS